MRIFSKTFEISEIFQAAARFFIPHKVIITQESQFNAVPNHRFFSFITRIKLNSINAGDEFNSGRFTPHPEYVFYGTEKLVADSPWCSKLAQSLSNLVRIPRIYGYPNINVTRRSRPPVESESPASCYHISHLQTVQDFEEVFEVRRKLLLLHTKFLLDVEPDEAVPRMTFLNSLDAPSTFAQRRSRNRSPNLPFSVTTFQNLTHHG